MPLVRASKRGGGVMRQSHDDSEIGLACSSHTTSSSSLVEDIDAADEHTYECIVEYVGDVIKDLKDKESVQHATLCAMPRDIQSDRQQLLGWMLELRRRMSLRVDTYALAVGILDRYTSSILRVADTIDDAPIITAEHAVGALMLAATLEETFPPETHDMVWFCNQASKEQADKRLFYECDHARLRTTSWKMASALEFDLWTATWLHFLRRFSKASRSSKAQHDRAKAFCSVMTENYAKYVHTYKPSLLAAAAVMKTRMTMMPTEKAWTATLRHYTGYSRRQVTEIVNKMN